MDDVTTIERKPNVATDKAVLFSMRNTPLLQQGTTYDPLATAENLWVNLKVYASGGENALHSHGGEDHASPNRRRCEASSRSRARSSSSPVRFDTYRYVFGCRPTSPQARPCE